MNQLELEQLVEQRDGLANVLARLKETIYDQQIIKETNMVLFGFKKLTEGSNIVIYGKQLASGGVYEVILDLTQPNLVTIHRNKQERTYGFEINSVLEFRELLIFGNLI